MLANVILPTLLVSHNEGVWPPKVTLPVKENWEGDPLLLPPLRSPPFFFTGIPRFQGPLCPAPQAWFLSHLSEWGEADLYFCPIREEVGLNRACLTALASVLALQLPLGCWVRGMEGRKVWEIVRYMYVSVSVHLPGCMLAPCHGLEAPGSRQAARGVCSRQSWSLPPLPQPLEPTLCPQELMGSRLGPFWETACPGQRSREGWELTWTGRCTEVRRHCVWDGLERGGLGQVPPQC